MSHKKEHFSSRAGYILSLMGVAVGAGNIWRFSRIVAQNGGGSFLIPWVIFLFIWSIPLIMAELSLGNLFRKSPIGVMVGAAGKKFAWMGAFIALVTTAILFYYSVVVGWGFRYFFYSITGHLSRTTDHAGLWNSFTNSFQPLFFHLASILFGSYVIYRGISKGIERTNKFLIPTLLVMILIIAIRAVTLPGAWQGIAYFFTPHFSDLFNYKVWLEALTQNAWDTGAGWGLLLVYAGYARKKESITVNSCLTAFANNTVSLLMGIIIFSTVFALESMQGIHEMISGEGSTNIGITFIYLPKLFYALPGGNAVRATFAAIFFLAFAFGALSSMISMLQLTAQTFRELGIHKNRAILLTGTLALFLGAPSALSMAFFDNQDSVWSLGLIINGLFMAFGVIRYGVNKFRKEVINSVEGDFNMGKGYNFVLGVLIPVQGIILLGWYFYRGITDIQNWWDPFTVFSLGTILFQWGIGLICFLLLNRWMSARTTEVKHGN
ncbi:MAG: sodium-dependent transporter [Chlamydiales bacterium]|nr:sodium-dependent transporter [Chlamydiales bacterium]